MAWAGSHSRPGKALFFFLLALFAQKFILEAGRELGLGCGVFILLSGITMIVAPPQPLLPPPGCNGLTHITSFPQAALSDCSPGPHLVLSGCKPTEPKAALIANYSL